MFMLKVTDSTVSPTQIALKVLPLSSSKLPHGASGPSSWKFRSSERRRGAAGVVGWELRVEAKRLERRAGVRECDKCSVED
jgi:hypothetical protein